MADTFNTSRLLRITDPNREPVRIVDQATFHGCQGSLLDVTLCTMTPTPDGQTNFVAEAVVTSRLRFDLSMAKALLEGIGKQVAMTESLQAVRDAPVGEGVRKGIN